MKIAIRADASLIIGSGHIMRCLTLATALRSQGAEIVFLSRPHEGNLNTYVQAKGFEIALLDDPNNESDSTLAHSDWLGTTQLDDARQCQKAINSQFDWLIIDHYAIDRTWQLAMKPCYKKLMVIDDLGDRRHECDVLLDQNYGSDAEKYESLVPRHCHLFLGTQFALLRPEFSQWRSFSIVRRSQPELKKLLINLGGVDVDNLTSKIIHQIDKSDKFKHLNLTVVLGNSSPHFEKVSHIAKESNCNITVKAGVDNMAELMANADLAIGAAGSTSWERCCLGLPTIQIVLAENQKLIAHSLERNNAAKVLQDLGYLNDLISSSTMWMGNVSRNAIDICDGSGSDRIALAILGRLSNEDNHFSIG